MDWLKHCILGDGGKPVPNVANALTALRHDPAIRDAFAYDEMLRAPVLQHEIAQLKTCERPVTDEDITDLQRWMQTAGLPRIGREVVRDALALHARERSYHPVADY